MKFDSTDPQEIPILNQGPNIFIAKGADFVLQWIDEDGIAAALPGSPITDGEQVEVITKSRGGRLIATASAVPSQLISGPITKP